MRGPFLPAVVIVATLSAGAAGVSTRTLAQTGGLHYVTDQIVLVVREAPDETSPKIATITTGDAVVVMASNAEGYAQVRLDDGTEGWVQLQYLLADPPAERRLAEAEDQMAILRIEKEQLTGFAEALKLDKADLTAALERTQAHHQTLDTRLGEAKAALQAATERPPENTRALEKLQEEVRLLHIRNRELKQSYEHRWFAAGGLLALLAVAFGLIAGRALARRGRNW